MLSTVLVAADDASFQEVLCLSLSLYKGLKVTPSLPACDGPALLANALKTLPEVIVADEKLLRMSGIEVLQELRRRGYRGRFIFMCYTSEGELYDKISDLGAEGILRKPFDPELLGDYLERHPALRPADGDESLISSLLLQWGIPAHVTGYAYAREAILFAKDNPELLYSLTGKLYPAVAKKFQTTPDRVERNIRHAVSVGWTRGDSFFQRNMVGYCAASGRGRPTNGEFIAALSEAVRERSEKRLRIN